MTRYYCSENDKVYTETELRELYEEVKNESTFATDSFERWLEVALNESLEKISEEWRINKLRRDVAQDIAASEDLPYEKVFEWMERNNVFGNWTDYEIDNRPVDVDELAEIVAEERGLK